MSDPLLEVDGLTVKYETRRGDLTAVSDASFTIEHGECLGLVGESGCGKSSLAKTIMHGLDDNAKITAGTVRYKGEEIHDLPSTRFDREIRWKEISWIPQSSMNSLDPLYRISEQAVTLYRTHKDGTKSEAIDRLRELFDVVGLPKERIYHYPHQFSGGMQQRAAIAFSLLLDPSLIIADEPTTALDVIMQDQIFKHIDNIQQETDTSILLITHDISVVFESCNSLVIMHSGQIAEEGRTVDVFDDPRHPYSILLQETFPDIRYPNQKLAAIEGHPPETIGDIEYCTFKERCPWAIDECGSVAPPLTPVGNGASGKAHRAGCIRSEEIHRLREMEATASEDTQ